MLESSYMKNLPLSYIEISKKNLIHNIKEFRKLVGRKTKIAVVVKANAYGHGDTEVAQVLDPYVNYFQVNSVAELARIRKITKKDVLLLGYVPKNEIAKAIKLGSIISVFDLHHLLLINQVARNLGVKQKVHIAIDAHLGREGIMPEQAENFIKEIKILKNIIVDGAYAHFANIEDTTNFSHAKKQIEAYEKVINLFKKNGYKNIKTHISATSGVFAYAKGNKKNNIVRIGIGLYGMWPSEDLKKKFGKKTKLLPVIKWVTHIAEIKTLPKGQTVGYGLTYKTKRQTTVAVVPQGYSDGVSRLSSNRGQVIVSGASAPIVGRVAMNMFVVDISKIKNVKPEDKVMILGREGRTEITAEKIAKDTKTINYEVTTRISPLLPRIVA